MNVRVVQHRQRGIGVVNMLLFVDASFDSLTVKKGTPMFYKDDQGPDSSGGGGND
jgi:hypothetical protein